MSLKFLKDPELMKVEVKIPEINFSGGQDLCHGHVNLEGTGDVNNLVSETTWEGQHSRSCLFT